MANCGMCGWYGKKGSMEWCYHPCENMSTSPYNPSCEHFKSR